MCAENEMTAVNTSVGADDGQSLNSNSNSSITDFDEKIKTFDESFDEYQLEMRRMLDPSYLKTVTMSELYDTVYKSSPPIIEGLLNPGTYLFVGAPKVGKSFMMAQLAYHVSAGIPLWGYPVRCGTVLYLALEDDYGRLQKRLYKMFGTESADELFFSVSAGQLGHGLDEQLNRFVSEHQNTRLIIIDTLQKVREAGGDNYSYASDYDIITRLKSFASSAGICLLLVHHTRKQPSNDKFDMISGTNGLLGAADGAFLLQKERRTADTATLDISGRDQQDQRLYLVRNSETLAWDFVRAETELWKEPPEPLLEEVAKHFTTGNSKWVGTPTELASILGVDMKPNTITMKLNVNAGRLFSEYGIRYESKRTHDGRRVMIVRE